MFENVGRHGLPPLVLRRCIPIPASRSCDEHQTLTIFTACWRLLHKLCLIRSATVEHRSAGENRRWHLTIAIVAALSLLVALVAGSSLRPNFAAAELPEPAAWTHGTQSAQAHASQVHLHAAAQFISGFSMQNAKKPFRNTWMTHDRPISWTHLSPRLGWLALPTSFTASAFHPAGPHRAASAATPVNRDTSTELCVVRC